MTAAQTMRHVADAAAAATLLALYAADSPAGLRARLARVDWLIDHSDPETALGFIAQRAAVVDELGRRGL